jgi:hypothetical protein
VLVAALERAAGSGEAVQPHVAQARQALLALERSPGGSALLRSLLELLVARDIAAFKAPPRSSPQPGEDSATSSGSSSPSVLTVQQLHPFLLSRWRRRLREKYLL